jgi:hypothetical protein
MSDGLLVLVCGSRDWRDGDAIEQRLRLLPRGATVMHGGARGADRLAGTIADALGFDVHEYPADWDRYGRSAGAMRSLEMLDAGPDLVLAFWKDGSKGTALTIAEASKRGIDVQLVFG